MIQNSTKPTIVIATANKGKKLEFYSLLSSDLWNIQFIDSYNEYREPEETGSTYQENAYIKASSLVHILPKNQAMFALADDSGIEVEALPGMFGVRSSRQYEGTTLEKNLHLLHDLEHAVTRNASYKCALCLIEVDTMNTWYFTGMLQGKVSRSLQGNGGFGFDPVFVPGGFKNTFAELGEDIKNTISHRAQATEQVIQHMQNYIHQEREQ